MTQQYPGLPLQEPLPLTGQANYVPPTPSPVVGTNNFESSPIAPEIGISIKLEILSQPAETGQPVKSAVDISPSIGIPNRTPLSTPLGLQPQFKTPTENWTWNYGSN
jgi:hypothetical protein